MKTYEELKSMGIDFNSLENERQAMNLKAKKFKVIKIFGYILMLIGVIILVSPGKLPRTWDASSYLFATSVIIGLGGLLVYYYNNKIFSKLRRQVMKSIMNEFFRKLNLDLLYGDLSKRREIKKNTSFLIKNSSFFLLYKLLIIESLGLLKAYSESIYDIISGSLNGQPFVMSNVWLRGDNGGAFKTLFAGCVGIIQASTNYPYTIIKSNRPHKLSQKNIYFKGDPDFEKSFAVKSNDKHFARNIVTAPLREYLKEIAKNNRVYFVLVDDKIIFASNSATLFRFSLEKSLDDAELKSIYDDFAEFYQIMEKIYSLITKSHTSDASPVSF